MEEQSPRYPDDSPAHGQSGPDPPSLQRYLLGRDAERASQSATGLNRQPKAQALFPIAT